jgi:hypothetical protein
MTNGGSMTTITTDDAIREAAIEHYSCADASIVRYVAQQPRYAEHHTGGDVSDLNTGAWFVLSIDRGEGWEVIARRRTKAELWAMLRAAD